MNISENIKGLIISSMSSIQTLLREDLRQKEKQFFVNGVFDWKEEIDTRVALTQSVEHLVSLVYPYADKILQDYYSKNIVYLSGWTSEILSEVKDEHFKKVYESAPTKSDDKSIKTKSDIVLSLQVRKAKEMFNQVNLFIQRTNLLRDTALKTEAQNYEQ